MRLLLVMVGLMLAACGAPSATQAQTPAPTLAQTLAQAVEGRGANVVARLGPGEAAPRPPQGVFERTTYPALAGPLVAYVTPAPGDGARRPAIIWLTGGDTSTIGDVWSRAPAANDQTARAFREAGMVMMFPSLRGGNDNPGDREGHYGEVNDVLAAAAWLAEQPHVDPARIYLGGHSTGGTLAMLVAERSDRFRAVFAFGPVSQVDPGYAEFFGVRVAGQRDLDLRSPGLWLASITRPTFVFEGSEQGNAGELTDMQRRSRNPQVQFLLVNGADHFSVLAPTTDLIARKILADTGDEASLAFSQSEVDAPFRR